MVRGLDGFLIPLWRCAVLKGPGGRRFSTFSGGHGEGETPLPIPNRAVKPLSADGTWPSRARESRTPPVLSSRAALWAARCFWGAGSAYDPPRAMLLTVLVAVAFVGLCIL